MKSKPPKLWEQLDIYHGKQFLFRNEVYTIKVVSREEIAELCRARDDEFEIDGVCNFDECIIGVRDFVINKPHKFLYILFHELTHLCLEPCNIGGTSINEEIVCNMVSLGLIDILPQLIKVQK